MKKILLFCVFNFLILSCKQDKPIVKEYKSTMNHVLEVHDEVMPEMSEINNLITKLQEKIDAGENSEKYPEALKNLKGAHAFMMEWMRDFAEKFPNALEEPTFSEEKFERKLNILKSEEKEVIEMKKRVESSIKEAKKLL